MVLPIIEHIEPPVVYSCPDVSNLRVTYCQDGNAVLQWDGNPAHSEWEFSYGTVGTTPEQGTLVVRNQPFCHITGLTDTHYVAYVRAKSIFDSTYYSEWSKAVDFLFDIDTTGQGGGGETEDMSSPDEGFTFLFPNPAGSMVQVFSSNTINRIAAYDLQGREVAETKSSGVSASFSVENWPKGIYVIVIETPLGTTS